MALIALTSQAAGRLARLAGSWRWLLLVAGLAPGLAGALTHAELELTSEDRLAALADSARGDALGQILINQARARSERDPKAALELLDQAEPLLGERNTRDRAYLYAARCWSHQHASQMEAARRSCQAAVSAGRAAEDPRALSRALTRQSIYYFNSGELSAAAQVAREAVREAETAGEPGQLGIALNTLGRITRAQGLYDQALAYFSRGMESVDPRVDEARYRVLAFNVGLSHADLGQFELALDYYAETLAWSQSIGSHRKELIALIYIAKADVGRGAPERAVAELTEAVLRPEFETDSGLLAQAYATLGDARLALGDAETALHEFRLGHDLADGSRNRFEHRELHLGEARTLLAVGQLPAARRVVDALVVELTAAGAGELLIPALLTQSEIARAQGDLTLALASYQEANRLQESLNRTVADQRLALARAEFEVDQTELALARAERDALWRNGVLVLTLALLVIGYLVLSRRAQQELVAAQRRERDKLERLVADRTRELKTEMASRAAVDAQRIDLERRLAEDDKLRVLGQLTGGVAHDFNNLLTVVMGSAELLKGRLDVANGEERQLLEHIFTAAASGAGITRALMAYARQQPLHLQKTDLEKFLRERLPLLEHTLGGSLSIELEVLNSEPVEVLLDRDQLTTALLNLALNARDAQNNRGTIRIVLCRDDAEHACLAVVDTGAGMTPEQADRACEPFYSTKEDGHGTGLGLSMVYGFIKQLGGDLKIESAMGEGTRVRMLLPLLVTSVDRRVA